GLEDSAELRARAGAVEREIDAGDGDAAARPGSGEVLAERGARAALDQERGREGAVAARRKEQPAGHAIPAARELEVEGAQLGVDRGRARGARPQAEGFARIGREPGRIHAVSLAPGASLACPRNSRRLRRAAHSAGCSRLLGVSAPAGAGAPGRGWT